MAAFKILIADDDKNICELLRLYLEKEGHTVFIANDGEEALTRFNAESPDIVLLDIMMPKLDGWQVCREIRKKSDTPIIMITAKGETFDKVLGLELGADDYVVKPFDTKEIVARVKAVLRRTVEQSENKFLTIGDVFLDDERHMAYSQNEAVELTYKEYELLKLLMRNAGIVMTREMIMQRVWDTEFEGESRTVDMHIKTLRKKLGENGAHIKTVRNVGYVME